VPPPTRPIPVGGDCPTHTRALHARNRSCGWPCGWRQRRLSQAATPAPFSCPAPVRAATEGHMGVRRACVRACVRAATQGRRRSGSRSIVRACGRRVPRPYGSVRVRCVCAFVCLCARARPGPIVRARGEFSQRRARPRGKLPVCDRVSGGTRIETPGGRALEFRDTLGFSCHPGSFASHWELRVTLGVSCHPVAGNSECASLRRRLHACVRRIRVHESTHPCTHTIPSYRAMRACIRHDAHGIHT
jgi:hypothetical protein